MKHYIITEKQEKYLRTHDDKGVMGCHELAFSP